MSLFFYPFRCDNSVIEDRRMEELEIKKGVLIELRVSWESSGAHCVNCVGCRGNVR